VVSVTPQKNKKKILMYKILVRKPAEDNYFEDEWRMQNRKKKNNLRILTHIL
jgi:hypothetical protein